jgi:hypothetical protein
MAHQYRPDLEGFLAAHDIPFAVRKGTQAICADRQHRLEAIKRWFNGPWMKLDNKVKASIVEGVVVFLSLFDENPEVYRAFCPERSTYANPPQPGERQPLPPLEDLVEKGCVLGLNFPVALNPALARGLGVMLKLDFQRAVLNRIPKITANPRGSSITPSRPLEKRTRPATSARSRCHVRPASFPSSRRRASVRCDRP